MILSINMVKVASFRVTTNFSVNTNFNFLITVSGSKDLSIAYIAIAAITINFRLGNC